MSTATTSDAPRRSISNAQNPSKVPTSRQRLPARSGQGSFGATLRVSNQPGVTTPGASSIVWYQSRAATSSASAAGRRSALRSVATHGFLPSAHMFATPRRASGPSLASRW